MVEETSQRSDSRAGGESADDRARARTLQGTAVTLIGVLASIGVTVGFGIPGPWWLRVTVGTATGVGLIVLVGIVGRRTPLLTRLAAWLMEPPA